MLGEVVVKLHPEWAPIGVERIKELTADSFWDGCRAFRVLPNFVVQLGINGGEILFVSLHRIQREHDLLTS